MPPEQDHFVLLQHSEMCQPRGVNKPTVPYNTVCLLFLQLCVSKCPDRFVTYIDVQASYRYKPDQWNYFKQFCRPGFNSPRKVFCCSSPT
ncbi:choline transporter-like protein 5-B isoform X2 [Pezoporus occidentalis]|uniref:choline transporter-like protein 5-B isoform X2 n=1 Tax=Pezoporus occidentalis TaxID=407982 RepID=UPI002F91A2AB